LPSRIPLVQKIIRWGGRFHWEIEIAGQQLAWDAIVTQFIPNEAIGWKSISGPKHTGRMPFSPLANDTLIHVQMNYAPPLGAPRVYWRRLKISLEVTWSTHCVISRKDLRPLVLSAERQEPTARHKVHGSEVWTRWNSRSPKSRAHSQSLTF